MKMNMDTIVFESRIEIERIITSLENSKDKDNETVKELIDKLDVMHMNW